MKTTFHPKAVAKNKKALYDYAIEEVFEAGLVLTGTEVKSIRASKIQLKDSYARIRNGEVFLEGCHISPYEQGNIFNHEPERTRKLLLNRKEINRMGGYIKESGYSLIPLEVYFKSGFAKVRIAIAKGKKKYDKREATKQKDASRQIDRTLREMQK